MASALRRMQYDGYGTTTKYSYPEHMEAELRETQEGAGYRKGRRKSKGHRYRGKQNSAVVWDVGAGGDRKCLSQ